MQIAVFIHSNCLIISKIDYSLRLVLEIHTDTTILGLYLYE